MTNVIEQIVQPASFGGQTIEMTVRSNERGPQGEPGEPGEAATITAGDAYTLDYGEKPQVMNSGTSSEAKFDFYIPEGKPGAVHYTAGPGISITDDNVIEATGGMAVYWGNIKGTLGNQTDLAGAINAKQNQLTAGTNITIANNTISAASYTAGSGLNLNSGAFSVDTSAIQTKLTAGSNVQINGSTISATNTTYNNFIGADGGSGGSAGLVPAPVASDNVKVLKGDGTWGTVTAAGVDKLSLLNLFYPVGSYYETSNTNFNPNTSWGGTWVEDTAGRVMVAYQSDNTSFNAVGKVGGEETHTLTVSEMPSHNHETHATRVGVGSSGNYGGNSVPVSFDEPTQYTGGDGAHNNLQPYIVIRRWHRTA